MNPLDNQSISLIPGKLNNRQSDLRLGIVGEDGMLSTVVEAVNVDIDNNSLASTRSGRSRVYEGTPHSFWVHPKNDGLAYFIESSVLKKLNANYSATSLSTLSVDTEMQFHEVGTEVVGTNDTDIGWVRESGFTAFSQALGQFELQMPAGKYLSYDFGDGCLLVAKDNVVYKSKPYNVEVRDERYSEFPFNGSIRMLGVVEDGWWVATDKSVGFVKRAGNDSFVFRNVSENVPADGCFLEGWEELEGGKRLYVAWASVDGFCVGRSDGQFQNLSKNVALPTGKKGKLFWRVNNGTEQFLASISSPEKARKYTSPSLPQYSGAYWISNFSIPEVTLTASDT